MIQEKVKTQLEQFKKQTGQVQTQLTKVLETGKTETQRILKELGVTDADLGNMQLHDVLTKLREANPTFKTFIRNLDVATYDTRFRFNWNSTMMSAYAKQQAEKAYIEELKPKLNTLLENINDQIKELQFKTQELRSKLVN